MSYVTSTYKASDVASDIKRTFGDEAGVQITDQDITRWIDSGQLEIFNNATPKRAVSYTALTAGQTDYDISSLNILRIHSIRIDGSPIEYLQTQSLEDYVLANDPKGNGIGQPILWSEWGGTISVYPKPAADGMLSIYYYVAPAKITSMSDSLSIPDTYYARLIDYILFKAYELDEDPQNSQTKLNQFAAGLNAQIGNEIVYVETYPVITILPEDE